MVRNLATMVSDTLKIYGEHIAAVLNSLAAYLCYPFSGVLTCSSFIYAVCTLPCFLLVNRNSCSLGCFCGAYAL